MFKDFSVVVGNANFNGDAFVDGKDFLLWQANFGRTSGATLGQGDADGDGDVDSVDLATWKAAFGGAASVASAGAIPELSSLALAVLGLTSLAGADLRPFITLPPVTSVPEPEIMR